MTEVPMERRLPEMPYEVLFEICRGLPKGKLFEISRLSSKFENVAKDTRLWKNVCIKYKTNEKQRDKTLAFEELYSGPFPVKEIDLPINVILPPAFSETNQVVKVTKLNWSAAEVKESTMKAMLARYQCTELHLDFICVNYDVHIMGIAPEIFSKQTGLEVLSLRGSLGYLFPHNDHIEMEARIIHTHRWLATVLSKYCINLKSLDLSYNDFTGLDVAFVKNLPTTLEKLYLIGETGPGNSVFELLAEHRPNLKEIGLCPERLECPALLKFKFLEALRINIFNDQYYPDLYKYLIGFPALKNVFVEDMLVACNEYHPREINLEALQTKLKPHGITITIHYYSTLVGKVKNVAYPIDGNLWLV